MDKIANDSVARSSVFATDERRRARNLLLQPSLQLKLPIQLLLLTAFFAVLVGTVLYFGFDNLYDFVTMQGVIGEQLADAVKHQSHAITTVFISMLVAYVLLTIGLSVAYLHKLVGPTVAFKRHINALKNGLYASRLTLRKNDAFLEVAVALNELAEILESKHHGSLKNE